MITNLPNSHYWEVSLRRAIQIQNELRKKVILSNNLCRIKRIAGVDVAFTNDQAFCGVGIFKYPELKLIEKLSVKKKIAFPYVPGLLTFREGPVIISAFRKLQNKPDLVLFDGQGICHPRQMGIATHLGIILNLPSIGCAKSHLCGAYQMPKDTKGSFSYIYPPTKSFAMGVYNSNTREVLGVALRTRQQVKPLFVSCGHKISLKQAIKVTLKLCPKYRIPEPLRYAHQLAEHAKLSI